LALHQALQTGVVEIGFDDPAVFLAGDRGRLGVAFDAVEGSVLVLEHRASQHASAATQIQHRGAHGYALREERQRIRRLRFDLAIIADRSGQSGHCVE